MKRNYAEEAKRLEDRSLKLFEYFTLMWGAILFFIFDNSRSQEILSTFFKLFDAQTYDTPSLIPLSMFIFFLGLLGLAIDCLWTFFKEGKLNEKDSSSSDMLKKANSINTKFNWAVLTTIGYILYLLYLAFISSEKYNSLIEFLIGLFYVLLIVLPPLASIKRKEKALWQRLACCFIVIELLLLVYYLSPIEFTPNYFLLVLSLIWEILFPFAVALNLLLFPNPFPHIKELWNHFSRKP